MSQNYFKRLIQGVRCQKAIYYMSFYFICSSLIAGLFLRMYKILFFLNKF